MTKDSVIARRAAELVFSDYEEYSCGALYVAGGQSTLSINFAYEYAKLFSPYEQYMGLWLAWEIFPSGIKNWRILALLFFAEILESEGR